jgi:hypothetical protein
MTTQITDPWTLYPRDTTGLEPQYPMPLVLAVHRCYRCGAETRLMLLSVGEHTDKWICAACLDLALGEIENDKTRSSLHLPRLTAGAGRRCGVGSRVGEGRG